MSLDRQVKPWQVLAALTLLAVVCAWIVRRSTNGESVAVVAPPAASQRGAANLGPANVPLPAGEWNATGRVVWVPGNVITNQPTGAILKRPWSFHRACQTCTIVFSRWTLYGPSVTRLVRHGRFFTAKFPPVRVPCSYPRGSSYQRHPYGASHDYYRLWWSGDGAVIHAIEHRTQTGCYRTPDPPDVTRWRAARRQAASGTSL